MGVQRSAVEKSYDINSAKGSSGRLYASDFVERFSRCHPITPLVIYVPLLCVLYAYAAVQSELSLGALLGYTMSGVFVWTLTEYWLHRTVFHFIRDIPAIETLHRRIHGIHHEFPNDMMRVVFPPAPSLGLAAVIFAIVYALCGPVVSIPVMGGVIVGYLWYDMTHWWIHAGRPRSAWGRLLRHNHLSHHFKDHDKRFGVTSPLWDIVFRTM